MVLAPGLMTKEECKRIPAFVTNKLPGNVNAPGRNSLVQSCGSIMLPPMAELTTRQIQKLRGMAQRLEPILKIGRNGVSAAFLASLDETLRHHELVKVKFTEFKEQKKELSVEMAAKSGSCLVARVGNVAVFYRENPDSALRKVKV